MSPSRFLIPSLLAAGFGAQDALHVAFAQATSPPSSDPNAGTLIQRFRQDHAVTLADHRSHSSHSSHSSHRSGSGGHYSHTSHRSSTGGYGSPVYTPPPDYSAPSPPPPPLPQPLLSSPSPLATDRATPPRDGKLPALSGRTHRFTAIVKRVQIGLLAQGVYEGPIDGTVGPGTRSALRRFQTVRGLGATGTITPETLDALRIASQ